MMHLFSRARLGVSAACLLLAAPLLFVVSDREFSNLTPTAGQVFSVPLRSQSAYAQTVTAERTSVTRLGLFFGGLAKHFPAGNVRITVATASGVERVTILPSRFIDVDGSTQIHFNPPIVTKIGEHIIIRLNVDTALDNVVSVQLRAADGSYDLTSAIFTIDGKPQPLPLAYQLYYLYRPPLATQMAGILLLVALGHYWPNRFLKGWAAPIFYGLVVSALSLLPAVLLGHFSWGLFLGQAVAVVGMYSYLRQRVGRWPALAGAHVFAFTTWFALHLLAGHSSYILLAFLPWAALVYEKYMKPRLVWQGAVVVSGLVLAWSLAGIIIPHTLPVSVAASWRDIFFDPNQVPSSQKIAGPESWEHFGSYLGFINAIFLIIGVIFRARRLPLLAGMSLVMAVVLSGPLIPYLAPFALVPLSHMVIILTFLLAIWTALGVERLQNFLGSADPFVNKLLAAFIVIALFDLWHVLAGTLEYTFLL